MLRVLHVVDRVEGGVPNAVKSYIANTSTGVEHVIASPFNHGSPAEVWSGVSATHYDLGEWFFHRIRSIRRLKKSLNPEVIHAHSSFSGVYARLATTRFHVRLIHTPHGYGFQRRDITPVARLSYYLIELLLGLNTSEVAACSPLEFRLAGHIPTIRTRRVRYVPNVSTVNDVRVERLQSSRIGKVGMVGRLSPAKDPDHFVRIVRRLESAYPGLDSVWIGDGDPAEVQAMEEQGIRVTGWLDGERLVQEIDSLDLYLHSSAWESFPLAILDVHSRQVPMLVRRIPAFPSLDPTLTFEDGLDRILSEGGNVEARLNENHALWVDYLANHRNATQAVSLRDVWEGNR